MSNSSVAAVTEETFYNGSFANDSNADIPKAVIIFHICFEILLFFPTVFGNALVIIAYCKFYMIKDEISNIFITSLAFTDFVNAFTIPMNMGKRYIAPLFGSLAFGNFPAACYFALFAQIWSAGASVTSLLAIAVDRTVAIGNPLRYQTVMSRRFCWALICFSHFFPLVMTALSIFFSKLIANHEFKAGQLCVAETVFHPRIGAICYAISFYVPLVLMYGMHLFTVFVAWKQKRKIAQQTLQADQNRARQYKILRTTSRIVGVFSLCFFPMALIKPFFQAFPTSPWWHRTLNNLFIDLVFLNSALNPVLYAVYAKNFQKAFIKILKCSKE